MAKTILKTEGLTKHYGGIHALVDADFEIKEGEHIAIVGDNGAGKSTFVRQITGVEQRTGGRIWFDGNEVMFQGPLEAREAGIRPLDAPVSGGEQGAIDAVLSIMVGGDKADFDDAQDVLNAVGKTIVHVGPSGSGQTVKAANQLIVAVNIEVLGEAIAFLEAYGVDTDAALKVLGGGLAGSKVLDQKGQKMLDRNFDPGFRLALHHKDLGIVTSAAREANVAIPLGAVVAQLVAATVNQGDGALDHSGLFKQVLQLSGRD